MQLDSKIPDGPIAEKWTNYKFERKLDPGTEQASHYASWVDFVDHDSDRAARRMEAREAAILATFGLPDPYSA